MHWKYIVPGGTAVCRIEELPLKIRKMSSLIFKVCNQTTFVACKGRFVTVQRDAPLKAARNGAICQHIPG